MQLFHAQVRPNDASLNDANFNMVSYGIRWDAWKM